jgi:hypothetical protein
MLEHEEDDINYLHSVRVQLTKRQTTRGKRDEEERVS